MTLRPSLPILAALVLAGCADNPQVRNLAAQLGPYAAAQQAASDDFKTRYDRYNGQLADRVVAQDAGTDEVVHATALQKQGWAAAGHAGDVSAFNALNTVKADDIVGALTVSTAAPTPLDAGNLDAQMKVAIAGAADLAKKPSTWDELSSFGSFVGGVQKTLTTLKQNAAKAAEAAKPAAPTTPAAKPAAKAAAATDD